jgi:hypothetical protein
VGSRGAGESFSGKKVTLSDEYRHENVVYEHLVEIYDMIGMRVASILLY